MDEDFFLYYEEVAFSRAAQRLGWRVEYDASVTVVHRHPLQNRAISPKMRVITRHSKLLYFLKHLPRWQFLSLAAIVSIEAAIRGLWSQAPGPAGGSPCVANDRRSGSPAARGGRSAGPRGPGSGRVGRRSQPLAEPGSVSESGVGSRPAHPAGPQVNAARTPRGPRRRRGGIRRAAAGLPCSPRGPEWHVVDRLAVSADMAGCALGPRTPCRVGRAPAGKSRLG